jgi:DNA-binding transcriptional LysR family regulator
VDILDFIELSASVQFRTNWQVASLSMAAIACHGVCFVIEDQVSPLLANGTLERVLEDWCPPFDGYHLYYPTRRQASPAFRILVDELRYRP